MNLAKIKNRLFSKDKTQLEKAQTNLIYICLFTIFSLIFAFMSILFSLKERKVQIMAVEPTGKATIMKLENEKNKTQEEISNIYYINRYIEYRESYNGLLTNENFLYAIYLSSDRVTQELRQLYSDNNDKAPYKIYKGEHVTVNIKDIIFLEDDVAEVHFETIRTNPYSNQDFTQSEIKKIKENKIALIKFTYHKYKKSNEENMINPLGFKVLSYEVNKENI